MLPNWHFKMLYLKNDEAAMKIFGKIVMALVAALPIIGVALGIYAAAGICGEWYGSVDSKVPGKHVLFVMTFVFTTIVSVGGIFFLISLPVAMCFPRLSRGLCSKNDLFILKGFERYALKMLEYSRSEQDNIHSKDKKPEAK